MVQFVILHHETPPDYDHPSHWDLMWEVGKSLRTWAVFGEPAIGKVYDAIPLPDHRSEYLSYEGPVSANRGHVTRCDSGECEVLAESNDSVRVKLIGRVLNAEARFDRDPDLQRWRVEFVPVE